MATKFPKHACHRCDFGTTWTALLYRHLLLHYRARPFFCEQCDQRFSLPEALLRHMRSHPLSYPYICSKCGTILTSELRLRLHQVVHIVESLHRCTHCGKGFLNFRDVQQHLSARRFGSGALLRLSRTEGLPPGRSAWSGSLRTARFSRHLADRWEALQPETSIRAAKPPFYIPCATSEWGAHGAFDFTSMLGAGRSLHGLAGKVRTAGMGAIRSLVPSEPGSEPDPELVRRVSNKRLKCQRKVHECHICHRVFPLLFLLNAHLNIHMGRKPFVCTRCNIRFYTPDQYRSHLWMHGNPGEVPNQCRICLRRYATLAELRRHKLVHSGSKMLRSGVEVNDNGSGELATVGRAEQLMWLNGRNTVFECGLCGAHEESFQQLRLHLRTCANLERAINYRRDLEIEIIA
ncbi:zinc finger protein 26 [Ixodes scapularis]|nr:zinc finger protein 26 [Ixodes scapularis]